MLAGEPVTIAGFIEHGGPGPLDELLVKLANGEERTVHRDELTSVSTSFRAIGGRARSFSPVQPRANHSPSPELDHTNRQPMAFAVAPAAVEDASQEGQPLRRADSFRFSIAWAHTFISRVPRQRGDEPPPSPPAVRWIGAVVSAVIGGSPWRTDDATTKGFDERWR